MPKIYEYFGLIFIIRTDDHNPIHVHIQYAETESKVVIDYIGGKLADVIFRKVKGRKQLPAHKQSEAKAFIKKYHKEITEKWIQLFVKKMKPKFEKITKKV